jgi:hypothetical protein
MWMVERELKVRRMNMPLVPGGTFILGQALNMIRGTPWDLMVRWMRQYGPVYRFQLFGENCVVVADPKALQEVFQSKVGVCVCVRACVRACVRVKERWGRHTSRKPRSGSHAKASYHAFCRSLHAYVHGCLKAPLPRAAVGSQSTHTRLSFSQPTQMRSFKKDLDFTYKPFMVRACLTTLSRVRDVYRPWPWAWCV